MRLLLAVYLWRLFIVIQCCVTLHANDAVSLSFHIKEYDYCTSVLFFYSAALLFVANTNLATFPNDFSAKSFLLLWFF